MANEDKKDFNKMLYEDKGMPKIQIVTDEVTIKRYGGERMYFAPPVTYDEVMKKIPCGKVITVGAIRDYLAKKNDADFTDPITQESSCRLLPGQAVSVLKMKHLIGGR